MSVVAVKKCTLADVAKAIGILLRSDNIAGESYACCDRYISEFEVATIAKEIAGSSSEIIGEPKIPKHQIDTQKLQALGMEFGSTQLLRRTIHRLVDASRLKK